MVLFRLIIFTLFSVVTARSQVYVSDYFNGDILVGPDNVMYIDENIKDHYITRLGIDIKVVKDHLSLIDSLQNSTKKKWKHKKQLEKLIYKDVDIERELGALQQLLFEWEEFKVMPIDPQVDYCYFDTEDLESRKVTISPIKGIYEFIDCETSPSGTKWIKKKVDPSCLDEDPNVCLVWCLVETGGHEILDFTNRKLSISTTDPDYFGFKFDDVDSVLVRILEPNINEVQKIYSIFDPITNRKVPFYKIETCEN